MSVLFKIHRNGLGPSVAQATLDAPKSLNSVSFEMIQSLREKLVEWQSDSRIAVVLIDASGDKAFCAGGDIVRLYQGINNKDDYPERFFELEYRLDYLIHTYSEPIVIWGDGIVMGGGMGIMQGGGLRVATERTKLAMPEITIGLYPDVGASYFLKNCPNKTGKFLAITGTRINGYEAVQLDLADFFIESNLKENFYQKLFSASYSGQREKDLNLLNQIALGLAEKSTSARPDNNIEANLDFIEFISSSQNPRELFKRAGELKNLNEWSSKSLKSLSKASPTSLGLIFEQFRRAEKLTLKEAFQMEWIVSVQCARHPDFREGIRALLIDKDNRPNWTPTDVDSLSAEWIENHFRLPEGFDQNPLEDL